MVTTGTNHERTNQTTTKPGVLATPRFSFFFPRRWQDGPARADFFFCLSSRILLVFFLADDAYDKRLCLTAR
jgi:hypothetical protein